MDETTGPRPQQTPIEVGIRIALIGLLVFWTAVIVQPFAPILVWSAALAVALYPAFSWLAVALGGRRLLAAVLITVAGLFVVVGPATWLGVGLVEATRALIERIDQGDLTIPPPTPHVKDWPVIGLPVFEFWSTASTNLGGAFAEIAPQLKPVGDFLLSSFRNAGAGTLKFLLSVILTGFFLVPGPSLLAGARTLAQRIDPARGETYLALAAATIHAVSRGVIGLSLAQAVIAGVAFWAVGAPGASLLTMAVLVLGIIQVGPLIIVAPTLFWAWNTLDTGRALAFTLALLTVNYMDNVLKPFLLARGLSTPMPVVFIGVVGGVLAHGVVGLFVGPVVLAVAWELGRAWIDETAHERE